MSTGQSLDDVLDMSWDHINFSAKAIMAHKSYMLEIIFDAVAQGLGAKKTNKGKNKRKKKKNKLSPQENIQKLESQISMSGLKIHPISKQ